MRPSFVPEFCGWLCSDPCPQGRRLSRVSLIPRFENPRPTQLTQTTLEVSLARFRSLYHLGLRGRFD